MTEGVKREVEETTDIVVRIEVTDATIMKIEIKVKAKDKTKDKSTMFLSKDKDKTVVKIKITDRKV